jgi:hypothetical protein
MERNKNILVQHNCKYFQCVAHGDLPVGPRFGISVKPRDEKYFALSEIEIVFMVAPFRADRGAHRDRHEARRGMRWTS